MLDNRNKNIILPILEQQNLNDIEKIENSLQNIQSVLSEYKQSIIIKDIIVLIIQKNYNNEVNEFNDTLFLLLALKKINRNDLRLSKPNLINKLYKENNNNIYLVIANIMDNLPPSVKDGIRYDKKIKLLRTLLECEKENFHNTKKQRKKDIDDVLYASYILKESDFRKKIISGLDGKKYFWDVSSNVLTEIDLNNLNNKKNNMPLSELEHLLKVDHKFKINNLNVLEEEKEEPEKKEDNKNNNPEFNNYSDWLDKKIELEKNQNNLLENPKKTPKKTENIFEGEYGILIIVGIVLICLIFIGIILVIFLVQKKPKNNTNNNVSRIFNRNTPSQ